MRIPTTSLDISRAIDQVVDNLNGLQRDIRNNAIAWRAAAQAQPQTVPVATLAQWMNAAAVSYQTRLSWIATLRADPVNWPLVSAMWVRRGGTASDFTSKVNPMTAVANQLGPAPKTTYAQIISACDQIIAAINAPFSIWPE